jgi:predicted nucleic acid-binding protein
MSRQFWLSDLDDKVNNLVETLTYSPKKLDSEGIIKEILALPTGVDINSEIQQARDILDEFSEDLEECCQEYQVHSQFQKVLDDFLSILKIKLIM